MGFFVRFRLLQRHDLGLGKHQPLLGHLRLQRLQPFPHRFQIVSEPDTPDTRRGDRERLFAEFIGDPQLPPVSSPVKETLPEENFWFLTLVPF